MENKYKLVAPDVDRLLRYFDRRFMNPTGSTPRLRAAAESLSKILAPLKPLKSNEEAKSIWICVPRGDISDYDSFDDLKEYGDVETYEEYLELYKQDYPYEVKWYELVVVESYEKDGSLFYYGVGLGDKPVITARINEEEKTSSDREDAAVELCALIEPAVKESLQLLKDGIYNERIENELPYWFRTGVVKRSDLWKAYPDTKERELDGLSEETVEEFRNLIKVGRNDEHSIGRIKAFTANDFFNACAIGYKVCGKKTEGMTAAEMYIKYSDGRDEGLTGTGHGLNEGPSIDFDDPKAWDEWYFGKRCGGHPWEIIPGGNSTHMDLFVCHDEHEIGYLLRAGKITEDEYNKRKEEAGYYFRISGKHRPFESVSYYTALSAAGLPVVLDDAEEILARFDGSDFVGIVPHNTPTKYCESLFPSEYGIVIDSMHIYDDEMPFLDDKIIWLPEEPAEIIL